MSMPSTPGNTFALLNADEPGRRSTQMRPAEPLPQHVLDSIAFLKRVKSIRVTGRAKTKHGKGYNVRVQLALSADEDATGEPKYFEIARTLDELDRVQQIVLETTRQHADLSRYNVAPCWFCKGLKSTPPLPTMVDKFFMSTATTQQFVEQRLMLFVQGAVVPCEYEYFCEGIARVPAAMTKFLLEDVDQSTL